ncbi:MAG: HigA family addiction module antidote protein [Trueperaceae bacterium]|nr:HigA family addiction module antidote protein [Trueperaceae bacterium]MCW5820545.1 HigA family addiction module antidote protein [Trueperaceae bacterium]
MTIMFDHPHPGEILKEDVLGPLGLSVTEAAERLGMTRPNLSRVLNGKAGISPELALRLESAGVSTAKFWMNLQTNYELAEAAKRPQPRIKPLVNSLAAH